MNGSRKQGSVVVQRSRFQAKGKRCTRFTYEGGCALITVNLSADSYRTDEKVISVACEFAQLLESCKGLFNVAQTELSSLHPPKYSVVKMPTIASFQGSTSVARLAGCLHGGSQVSAKLEFLMVRDADLLAN